MKQLEGRAALILGAASAGNIGQAIARRFSAEGAHVVVAGRHPEPLSALAEELNGDWALCDITDEGDLDRTVNKVLDRYGRLDIAINSTGKNHRKSLLDTTRAEMEDIAAVQFIGPMLFLKTVVRGMKQAGNGGSIIQISSVTSTRVLRDHALYMGTKAGIDHVVRAIAYDYGRDGIRVNSISPSATIDGPMAAFFFEDTELVERAKQNLPLGRFGTAADIAEAAVWLSTDGCFLTGQLLQVNGGTTLT